MLCVSDISASGSLQRRLASILDAFALRCDVHPAEAPIPASYWGEPEAGIESDTVHVRADTPIHSLLHELCHLVCMGDARRKRVFRDAGGTDSEEAAVCYLQLCLADRLLDDGWPALARDMDEWGYSFPASSTEEWFKNDADDAARWLVDHGFSEWLVQVRAS
ncbi:MAG: hypothetical protein AAAFM81_12445 [Pseudomonadota bacterium]